MLLCGGDKLLFALFAAAILCLLIGGSMWGSGEAELSTSKLIAGLVIFVIGGTLLLIGSVSFLIKAAKRRQNERNFQIKLREMNRQIACGLNSSIDGDCVWGEPHEGESVQLPAKLSDATVITQVNAIAPTTGNKSVVMVTEANSPPPPTTPQTQEGEESLPVVETLEPEEEVTESTLHPPTTSLSHEQIEVHKPSGDIIVLRI